MLFTNELDEAYVLVSDFGEATIADDGSYHVKHAALYEDRYVRSSLDSLFSLFETLDSRATEAQ